MDVLEKMKWLPVRYFAHRYSTEVHPTLHIRRQHYQPGKVQHNHEKLEYLLAILGDMLDKADQMLAAYTEIQELMRTRKAYPNRRSISYN
jgi:hypothetical protein